MTAGGCSPSTAVMCMTLQIGSGLLLAVILNRSRYEKILVTVFLMPMMMAPVVAGLVWYYLYNSTFGWYHWLMQSAGILGERSILGDPSTAMIGIVIVDTWQWTPLITLIVLAGLKRVPRDQLEANMVDGAGEIRNFFQITLPNIYPFLLIAILLRFMDNFRFIDHILVLTGGGPADSTKILPTYLFDVSFQFFKLGRGAAIALTLLAVTIILGLHPGARLRIPDRADQAGGQLMASSDIVQYRSPLRTAVNVGVAVFLAVYVVWTVLPLFVMFVSSFKDLLEAFKLPRVGDWAGSRSSSTSRRPSSTTTTCSPTATSAPTASTRSRRRPARP